MTKNDIDLFSFIKILIQVNINVILKVNSVNNAKKIKKELKWHIKKNKQLKLEYS